MNVEIKCNTTVSFDRVLKDHERNAVLDEVLCSMNAGQTQDWLRHSPYQNAVVDAVNKVTGLRA